jgi:hypothetical protein
MSVPGRPMIRYTLKPIFFELSQLRTELANIFDGAYPNCR